MYVNQTQITAPKKLTWIEVDPMPKLKKRDDQNSSKVVQTAPGTKTEQAAPDAFLGERTQTVDRQTVSKKRQVTVGKGQPKPKTLAKRQAQPRAESATPRERVRQGPLSKFGIPMFPDPKAMTKNEDRPLDDSKWSTGQQLSQDYVKGFKESERTALNTKEFVFYGYFQRIRQRLDMAWTGILREHLIKLYRGGRQLASDMDHTTQVMVTMSRTGEVVRVQILQESGTLDLDDAAIEAFNKAGPFPNPPSGIADRDGKIEIRWDFILRT